MSNPYPWIKDSQYGTTPSVTGYLEVTSTNGLYLNSKNSQVLLQSPTTSDRLTLNKSSIDFINTNGNSVVLIDNTHIHLNELTPSTTPFTTDITFQNIILQSQNYIKPYTQTLTLQPNLIQQLNPDFSMIMGTGSLQTQALANNYTSTFNPYVCNLGFDGGSFNGDLNCRNIVCSLINGYAPTTTGLIWSDFNNAYPNLLNGRYYLTDTTFETYQDTQQFYARNMSSNQLASYNWNGINTQNGTFTLQTNGYNFDLNCATFNINGTPYSPGGGGGGVTDIQAGSGISVNQNTGSVTITNTGGGGGGVTDIQAGPGISVNQNTGSVTITNTGGGGSYGIDYLQAGSGISVSQISIGPNVWQIDNTGGGGGSQSLQTTLGYGNSAYSNIDMTNYDIVNVNNIATTNINSVPYRATTAFTAFNTQLISNGQIYQGGNQAYFLAGTYSITYSMTFDNNFNYNGPGNPPPYMVQGYCFLHSVSNGTDYNPNGINNAFIPGTFISNKSGNNTFINVNDTITLGYSDNYSLGCYFYNDVGLNSTMYLSAVLTQL